MPTTKAPNGENKRDWLADLEDTEPDARTTTVSTVELDRPTIERFAASFGRGVAINVKRTYPTEEDARKETNILLRHALAAADTLADSEGNSLNKSAKRIIKPVMGETGVTGYTVKFQTTHRRRTAEEVAADKEAAEKAEKEAAAKGAAPAAK